MNKKEQLLCPECGRPNVAVTVEQMFMVNSGDHYCHTVKAHDADAKVKCISCGWQGVRQQLVTVEYF